MLKPRILLPAVGVCALVASVLFQIFGGALRNAGAADDYSRAVLIAESKLAFDSMSCVECGTCRAIGPKDAIRFGYENRGRGVSYSFG